MAKLSLSQMEMYARSAGLPQPKVWAAVGMAESGGDTNVVNSIGCVGIWQINQPVHVKSNPSWTVKYLQNPANNARAAAKIYRSQGMNAWEAFTGPDGRGSDGPWRAHFKGDADAAAKKLGATGGQTGDETDMQDVAGDVLDNDGAFGGLVEVAQEVGRVAQALAKAGNWLSQADNWVRIGYVAGGAVLVYGGLAMVMQGTPFAKAGRKAVGLVAGKGRARRSAAAAAGQEQRDQAAAAEREERQTQRRVREAYETTKAREAAKRDSRKASE